MENTQTPVPAAPTPNSSAAPSIAELAAEMQAQAPAAEPAQAAPPAPAPVEPPKAEPMPVNPALEQSFSRLAQKEAAFRAEQERVKPYIEALKTFSPQSLASVTRSVQAGDPISALQALGFTANQVAKYFQPQGAPQPPAKEEPKAFELPPEIREKVAKVDDLEKFVAQQRRNDVLSSVKQSISAEKYRFIDAMGAHDMVLGYLENFHAKTGTLPSEDFGENVTMAAEAVNKYLEAESKKWEKVLTGTTKPASVQGGVVAVPPGEASPPKTITNQAVAPRAAQAAPTTQEDVIKALLSDPNFTF